MTKWSGFHGLYFFNKKSRGGGVNNEIKQNEQLAEELHKPVIKTF